MSSAGRAASSSDCVTRRRGHEIGLIGFAVQIQRSSLTGSYVMATAEHREPYESRGSRTVLGAPGGEIPPGDSSTASIWARQTNVSFSLVSGARADMQERNGSDRYCCKRFCPSGRARLIQVEARMRNIDSNTLPRRFDCCRFLFHRTFAATFATISASSRHEAIFRIARG